MWKTFGPPQQQRFPDLDNQYNIVGRSGGPSITKSIPKWWGKEVTHYNNEYCCKVLYINPHGATSMHFHIHKHETLLVAEGNLTIEILSEKTSQKYELVAGQAFIIPPGLPHKLINESTVDGLVIVESSTLDSAEDSIRVF